jgi:hypothetical protein
MIRMIKSRNMVSEGHTAHMREMSKSYRILVGTTEGKRSLWRTRSRWYDYIKMTRK